MKIGELANATAATRGTVRFYEKAGLSLIDCQHGWSFT